MEEDRSGLHNRSAIVSRHTGAKKDASDCRKVAQMADWIEQRHAELKLQKAEIEKKQVWGGEAIEKLEMAVRHDVARWNELNPGYRRRIDGVKKLMRSGAFRVYKTSFPPAMVDAVLVHESGFVMVEATTVRPGDQRPHTQSDHLILSATKNGFGLARGSGKALSFAEASQVLLEPIIKNIG
jgi:hypothetical protein